MSRIAGFKLTEEHKRKIGIANYKGGKTYPNCTDCGKKLRNTSAKRCRSCSKIGKLHPMYGVRGKDSPFYTGKSTKPYREKVMSQFEYRMWRKNIFERDEYKCVHCNKIGGYLNAHHIKKWKDFPKLRYSVDNGITLCKQCHYEVHYA